VRGVLLLGRAGSGTRTSGVRDAVLLAVLASLLLLLPCASAAAGAGEPAVSRLVLSGPGFHPHRGAGKESDVNVCSYAVSPGTAHCDLRLRTNALTRVPRPRPQGGASPATLGDEGAYDPAYLQSAYDVAAAAAAHGGGKGQIVAIVDAYDDPNVAADLAHYRSYFGLPACPVGTLSSSVDGCVFEKVNQRGERTAYPSASTRWSTEISLDVDMVSAICASCQILLVEANSNSLTDLGAAVNEAVRLGASVVSNSYGGEEFAEESAIGASYYDHPGVAIVAAAGDSGYRVEFPAASRYATAVGGTSLEQLTNTGTRDGSETAWSGTGAGCSLYEAKPSWQTDGGCPRRSVADVSAVANPETGVWVYDSYGERGWAVYGGTSVASPIIGSFYALAGALPDGSALPAAFPYSTPSALYDVTSGSDGSCSPLYLCTAGLGYDGPTGLGSPGGSPSSIAAFTPGVETSVAPTAPTGLTATAGNAQVTLSWSASTTGSPPITYTVLESTTSATSGFAAVKGASGLAGTTFTVTGLANGTTYYFRVVAANAFGESTSATVAATPGGSVPGALSAPTASAGNGQVTLSWSAPATGTPPITYTLLESTTSATSGFGAVSGASGLTGTSFTVTGLANGTTYYFRVVAANAFGESTSATVSATPGSLPGAPTGLVAAAVSFSPEIALKWRAPASSGGSPIKSYTIYRGKASGGESAYATVVCATATCTYGDRGTSFGQTFYYTVAAVNGVGAGPRSNEASARAF